MSGHQSKDKRELPPAATSTRSPAPSLTHSPRYVVLTGNPNCGKTTLFNALTGLRAKVGNYAGVTVERKEGRLLGSPKDAPITVLDLPGTYSLSPQSLDEQIARDVLFHRLAEVPPPNLVVVVVDASNLQRNLYYATQAIELGYPTAIALNMVDVAAENGHEIDARKLAGLLGVPVFPMVASTGPGIAELCEHLLKSAATSNGQPARRPLFCDLPPPLARETETVAVQLNGVPPARYTNPLVEALLVVSDEKVLRNNPDFYPSEVSSTVAAARQRLDTAGIDWRSAPIEARYARVAEIQQAVTSETLVDQETFSDRLDRLLTHKVWGVVIFVAIMTLMFESIFSFAELPMKLLEDGVNWIGAQVGHLIPPGDLHSLLVDGVIAGVGAVVVFLPQICLLFLFIGLLEDTGYMARAAFLMDRLMSKVGLHGKSFIPMLSSFACAIPGIMATRTIETPKDRLVTILVAPLMSCSARLPVYTLLIAACIPARRIWGVFKLQGLTMLGMYLLGIVVALLMAWLFKKTLLKGETPMLIMELPPYKRPVLKVVLRHMWDRSKLFLRRAGTVILGISIVLWFLATYPRDRTQELLFDGKRKIISTATYEGVSDPGEVAARRAAQLAKVDSEEAGEKLRRSFAGLLGRAIEPAIAPLGMDWKIGIGVVASFAAREVFVSTMSTVYNVGQVELDKSSSSAEAESLAQTLRAQTRADGSPLYTPLMGLTLMVFYVFALQCVSTVAIVRRETNSWKWPVFQWAYMGALAWVLAFVTYQGGRLIGLH
ncbi:MAG: ferrous iron transport protein B [Verrucomicrobia bacterium]|nr:ferrous iron transport protein B [Verrucomicrobiota bacterium]